MNTDMFSLAKEFVQRHFKSKKEIIGVLLRGSAVIGVRDKFVDLDFDLIVTNEFLNNVQPMADETIFKGVEVCWGYKSLESIEAELRDWLRDTDLWAYSTAKVMYDPSDKLKVFLDKYRHYPEPVRLEKMFSYFYHATAASPYNSDRAIHRQEYPTAQLFLTHAVELYTALLYLINKSFIPYRKWRIRLIEKLPRKPDNFVKSITKVLFSEEPATKETLHEKQAIITQIMNEIRPMLIQGGVDPRKLGNDLWRYEPKYLPSI